MNPVRQTRKSEARRSTAEYDGAIGHDSGPQLRLTVVFSTRVGTLAALKKAGTLARNLGARIVLVVPEVVPVHFPLDRPPVPVGFLERREVALVSASGVEADEVHIEIYLCRDRWDCLQKVLKSSSLVVIGGKRRWWFGRERKLERYIRTWDITSSSSKRGRKIMLDLFYILTCVLFFVGCWAITKTCDRL